MTGWRGPLFRPTPLSTATWFFAAANGTAQPPVEDNDMVAICHAAALCLSRAVARGIRHATPEPGDILPCWPGS